MVKVLLNNETIEIAKNWDSALRICANLVKSGINQDDLKIISNRNVELPVSIKHLLIANN